MICTFKLRKKAFVTTHLDAPLSKDGVEPVAPASVSVSVSVSVSASVSVSVSVYALSKDGMETVAPASIVEWFLNWYPQASLRA